jgi:hypothetical protein
MSAFGRFFPVQTVHLGPLGAFATFNEAALPMAGQLGMVVESEGKVYRLVKFDNGAGNVASAAGGAAHWSDRANFVVTSDQTNAQAAIASVAGGFLGVVTDGCYCFIQIGGKQTVITDTNADAGDLAIGTTTDLTFAGVTGAAAPYFLPVGVFYTADGATTSADMYWLLGIML